MVIKQFKIQNTWSHPESLSSVWANQTACLIYESHSIVFLGYTTTHVNITSLAIYVAQQNNEPHSHNHCCLGKAVSTTYSELVFVALVVQHKHSNSHIILPSVIWLALTNFSTLSNKQHYFQENITEHKICVLILSTIYVWNISHSKKTSIRY